MKNPNGFGSVYKLSGKRRKPYIAVITVGYTIDGKQKRKTLGSFETKVQAIEKLTEYYKNPDKLNTDKLTFKNIYEMWSKEHYKRVSEKRIKILISIYDNHLSFFNKFIFKDIKLIIIQDFFNNINLSTGFIKEIKAMLNMIYLFAVKNDIVEKNIIEFIELRKHKPKIQRRVFTDEEINILWNNMEFEFVDTILIMIYTGLRINELLNLKVNDIDLENKKLFVTKSKTEAGIRTIPINNQILKLITDRMKNNNSEYLITHKKKKVLYNLFRVAFKNVLEKIGINDHTIHDCRHTTATLLSNAGANPVSIANILGHTDYAKMTAKVYTHKSETELKKAMDLIQ